MSISESIKELKGNIAESEIAVDELVSSFSCFAAVAKSKDDKKLLSNLCALISTKQSEVEKALALSSEDAKLFTLICSNCEIVSQVISKLIAAGAFAEKGSRQSSQFRIVALNGEMLGVKALIREICLLFGNRKSEEFHHLKNKLAIALLASHQLLEQLSGLCSFLIVVDPHAACSKISLETKKLIPPYLELNRDVLQSIPHGSFNITELISEQIGLDPLRQAM